MRIAIMQPYFLPYIGYFQLIAAVDTFIFLDDVNYINRGWINRNRIPDGPDFKWLTLPLSGASQNRLINEIDILPDDGWKKKTINQIANCYKNCPFYADISAMVSDWITSATGNLANFLVRITSQIITWLSLPTTIINSSSLYPKLGKSGQYRILDICQRENATIYVNPPGGVELYDKTLFSDAGIDLRFLRPELNLDIIHSPNHGCTLSFLDLMMRNDRKTLSNAVNQFNF